MRRVRVLDAARREYADAVRAFRARDQDFAVRMVDAYRQLIRRVRRFPQIGTIETEFTGGGYEVRRHLLRRYRHKVIIADSGVELVVVAVAHSNRPPGYWRERLKHL